MYNHISGLVEFAELFPEEEEMPYNFYIKDASKETLVEMAHSLVELSQYSFINDNLTDDILSEWFSEENTEEKKLIYNTYKDIENAKRNNQWYKSQKIIIFSPYPALKLLSYVMSIDIPKTGIKLEKKYLEVNVLKLLTLINKEENKNEAELRKNSEKLDLSSEIYSITLHLPQYDIINCHLFKVQTLYMSQLARIIYLFEFLSKEFPELSRTFLEMHGKVSAYDYIGEIRSIIRLIINNQIEVIQSKQLKVTHIGFDPDDHRIIFFDKISIDINKDKITDDPDFRPFREKPLIKLNENTFLVVSSVLFIQKLFNSIYFDLNKINKKINENEKIRLSSIYNKQLLRKIYTVLSVKVHILR